MIKKTKPYPSKWGMVSAGPKTKAEEMYDGFLIRESGASSANRLGLSLQVPVKPYYWTNGPSGIIDGWIFVDHVPEQIVEVPDALLAGHLIRATHYDKNIVMKSGRSIFEHLVKNMTPEDFAAIKKNGQPCLKGKITRTIRKMTKTGDKAE